jgi:hypothetical protein
VRLQPEAWGFALAALFYFVLTLAYSFRLKHEVIIEVLCVAAGFVIRVVAGCLAIPVLISPWIIFCTFTLALFIALCKRRAELLEMGEGVSDTRRVCRCIAFPYSILLSPCIRPHHHGLLAIHLQRARFDGAQPALHDKPLLMTPFPL